MSRKPRLIINEATYHVTARANRGENIMEIDGFKELFTDVLEKAKKKFCFEVYNLVIMSNHIHLMIKPGHKESLSAIMQWILSVFAIRYNRLNKLKGHVWYDRFKSKIISSLLQFVRTFIYITENPMKAGICNDLLSYKYNGIIMNQQKRYRDIFSPPEVLYSKVIDSLLYKRHNQKVFS